MARPIDDQDQNSDEIPSQCRSGGAAGVDDDEEEMVSPQHESGEKITESIEKSQHMPSSERSSTSAAPGFDEGEDNSVNKSDPSPPTSSAPISFYSLRHRNKSKLIYDAKYHPMDDAIRPTQAARRRTAHGEKQTCFDSDDSSEASVVTHTDAEESSDENSEAEEEPVQNQKGKKRKLTQLQLLSVEPTRRSSRKVSEPKISYNMNVHPQDEFLLASSDEEEFEPKKKPKRSKHMRLVDELGSESGIAPSTSTSTHRKYTDYVDNSTSDELEFDSGHFLSSVETGTDPVETSLPSPVIFNPQNSMLHKEDGEAWNLSPGKRRFRHDKDAWPVAPGQPFDIFCEKLADQLDREAHAASPLNYEHDDKENEADNDNIEIDPLSTTHTGVSIIPETQYRQSSEDHELSTHHALINYALYEDPHPQTYGLDGAHCSRQEEMDAFSESMNILASGRGLPFGKSTD